MSERISIDFLRRTIGPDVGELSAIPIQVSTLLALVEAVEAAHAVASEAGRYAADGVPVSPSARALYDALQRFEFEERP